MKGSARQLKNLVARNGTWIVSLLASAGLLLSIGILAFPWAGDSLNQRADVSMAVATAFALAAAIVAVVAASWVTTSDYHAEQAAKKDIAQIKATLQSCVYKAELRAQWRPTSDPFKAEREAINAFVISTTSLGLRKWIARRPKDEWDDFYVAFGILAMACEPPEAFGVISQQAKHSYALLATLSSADVESISALSGELTGDSPVSESLFEKLMSARNAASETSSDTEMRAKFRHLKAKGVTDPNVDMFLAVFDNDTDALEAALLAGANKSITDLEVLDEHAADLTDFDSTAMPSGNGAQTDGRGDLRRRQFLHLKDKGVVDPTVDLFLAVFAGDLGAAEAAVTAGADPATTDTELLDRYSTELADFQA
jgi:hypothetical protein